MLDPKEIESLFSTLRDLGYEDVELYLERGQSLLGTLLGKVDETRFCGRNGTCVRATRDGLPRYFFVDGTSIESIQRALKNSPISTVGHSAPGAKSDPTLWEHGTKILQVFRNAFSLSTDIIRFPCATFALTSRRYQVVRSDASSAEGFEQSGEIVADWRVRDARFQWERARRSLAALTDQVTGDGGLVSHVRSSLQTNVRWPSPRGRLPVLWSARAAAKLQSLFLRAFEGDRVLDGMSLLNEMKLPCPLSFDLEDRPEETGQAIDHEGSCKKPVTLFRDGRPTALACTRRIAEKLEVSPTGHARRQSFEALPTTGIWNAHIEGKSKTQRLLTAMNRGISVQDIEILSFDPVTSDLSFVLSQGRLVHQGAEGESIEPLRMRISLVELLESFREFELDRSTTGISIGKNHQRVLTEVTTSPVLSPSLLIPGQVPLHHYW